MSFFTIGIIWVNHHARVNLIAMVDRTLLFLNLVLLLFVVFIPFATATMATYLTGGSEEFAHRHGGLRGGARGDGAELHRDVRMVAGRGPHPCHGTDRPAPQRAACARSIGTLVYAAVFVVAFISAPIWRWRWRVSTAIYYIFAPVPHTGVESERQGADVRALVREPGAIMGLSNVTDMAQATLSIRGLMLRVSPN